jgi:hypothetical protein
MFIHFCIRPKNTRIPADQVETPVVLMKCSPAAIVMLVYDLLAMWGLSLSTSDESTSVAFISDLTHIFH